MPRDYYTGRPPGLNHVMSIIAIFLIIIGFVALIGGAEFLVRGGQRLALAMGISPLVIGLTVIAFGTSAPEAAIGIYSAIAGEPGIAVGNIVGSNIFNILFVLGLAATISPLVVAAQLVRLEVPLMIGVSILFFVLTLDGFVGRLEGLVLFIGVLIYTTWAIKRSRRENADVVREYEGGFSAPETRADSRATMLNLITIAVGMVFLVAGSRSLVAGASEIARSLGVSELIVGLTIVSIGTSLPEVATSILAVVRGESDIAVGNAVGSNIFNILAAFGLTALVAPHGISIPDAALRLDIPVMVFVAIACLPIFFTGHLIARWEGMLFFAYYWVYIAYLVLAAGGHSELLLFNRVVITFLLPLTVLTLVISVGRAWKAQSRTV